ncbi:RING/U-box superfamily protein [Arabidopsis thaliana]|uniref:RING/U-box superfamily protein n=4 Tax=Arabidopsis TaxID=3701 RepID=A0A1I9LPW5_ARATH|nr:RING/U-box superfamily protein [Arabidopsis thaliana]ANM64623.1 RING/U-box superfamily protein [Arabidopsis thaliana]|eukprot:NP_189667.2 RING/U-box superfamily protein [Arabidopsis thaliana]
MQGSYEPKYSLILENPIFTFSYNHHLHPKRKRKKKSMAEEFHLPLNLTEPDQTPTEEDFEADTTLIDDEYLRYLHYLDSRSNHGVNTFGSYDEIFGLVLGNSSSCTRWLNAGEELPVVEFTAEEMMERGLVVCAICREELAANERLSELPCRHYYHKECISNWLSNRNTCPLCRHNVELPNHG